MKKLVWSTLQLLFCISFSCSICSQNTLKGIVIDGALNDPLPGASVFVQGTNEGTSTDWDGTFEFETTQSLPLTLEISFTGFEEKLIEVTEEKRIEVYLETNSILMEGVEVVGSRISDKQKESPLTVESMDLIAIKETPAVDFYDGLGSLKGVDLTAASLGFKVVNTRGFNSTSPVRSLQIIDGVDNQAPGLNFSLGNFLGTSELDVNKVELIVGASSAFYGPNAFNGVISMETKDPFFSEGLSVMIKGGERNLLKTAIRYAGVIDNKAEDPVFGFKLNLEYLRADDWVANNYDPVDDSRVDASNVGRFDAVNIYGDEYQSRNDFSSIPISQKPQAMGTWYRTGYQEEDLVDYDTRNLKANAALHFRLSPSKREQSPEIVVASSFGSGTTVYQGDNRFSLRNITFWQNKIEFRKKNTYFLRAYTTRTSAGDSYDPYFTALQLQENGKDNTEWSRDYVDYWLDSIQPQIDESDFPQPMFLLDSMGNIVFDPTTGLPVVTFDVDGAENWLTDNQDLLTLWHTESAAYADGPGYGTSMSEAFYQPGTQRFEEEFNRITSSLRSEGGTKFFDNSALYHVHGEYTFKPYWINKIVVGGNYRQYAPESRGTVFYDSTGVVIRNSEFGFYSGAEKSIFSNKVKLQVAVRADKNENFDWLFSPAGSIVYTPSTNNYFRASFSSAIRNPTLSDQYLQLDVGRATLSGNLNGVENLVTVESLEDYFSSRNLADLDSFNIRPIRPEEVKTFEIGARTTLFQKLYLDAGYYFSEYKNFIGFNIGVDAEFDELGFPTQLEAFRYSANSDNQVTTQGFSLGANYFLGKYFAITGNYSWNQLVKTADDDPTIPAFNTPEHKYNIGFNGRDIDFGAGNGNYFGFSINYKWIEGFIFEGSPQFTGFIPSYDLLDVQVNYRIANIDTTIKLGASNVLDNRSFQTYGGPRIGRLAYIALTYEP